MKCLHCSYSCTSNGEDMSRETFLQACKLAEKLDHIIDISGGEPTLHPKLWDFIGIALRYGRNNPIYLPTNGKLEEEALALARLARNKVIRVDLSLDKYHEPISYKVVQAFEKDSYRRDFRAVRDVTHKDTVSPAPFGRAKDWADLKDNRCPCNDVFVTPRGTLYACGCQVVTYGTVYEPKLPNPPPEEWCSEKLGW